MPFLCSQPLNNYLLICPQIILCAKHTSIAWWYMWICCYLSVVIYCSSSAALFCTGSGKALERTDISTGSHLPGSTSSPALHSLAVNLQAVTQRPCCTSTSEMNECKHLKSSSKNFTLPSLVSFPHHSKALLWVWALGWPGFHGVSPNQKLQRDISRALALWPLPQFTFTLLLGCWVF